MQDVRCHHKGKQVKTSPHTASNSSSRVNHSPFPGHREEPSRRRIRPTIRIPRRVDIEARAHHTLFGICHPVCRLSPGGLQNPIPSANCRASSISGGRWTVDVINDRWGRAKRKSRSKLGRPVLAVRPLQNGWIQRGTPALGH